MPGICGIVGSGDRENLSAQLAQMMERMKHYPWYSEQSYCNGSEPVALGQVSLGAGDAATRPVFRRDGSGCAVVAGELYSGIEKRAESEVAGGAGASGKNAETLLDAYEKPQAGCLRDLHGSYAAAIWDRNNERLILTNDRFGMRPLYYAKLPGRLLFASEIKALLVDETVARRLNLRGIAQFFTFGQLLGNDTLLDSVQVLPPAAWLIYDVREDRLTVDRYWRPELREVVNESNVPDLLDRIDEAFGRAVERRVRNAEGLGLSLSGGLDARTILAAIDHERVPITTVSIGIDGCLDHRSATQLANLSGCPHHCYTLDDRFLDRFEQHLRHMVHLTDGHYLSQCIVMPTLPVYRELGIKVLLRGHAGELMHMEKAYNFSLDREALAIRDDAGLEDWLFRHLRAYMLQATGAPLFNGRIQQEIDALARDSLRSCLRESAGIAPPLQRIWHTFISQRLRRETAMSLVKFGSLVEVRLPYLDNDLVDLLLAIPPELKLSDQIQSHILARRRPEFLNVINVNTGTRLRAGRLARWLGTTRMRVLAKLGVRGYQPYERLGLWLRRELKPLVKDLLLADRSLSRGIFNTETVQAVIHDHWAGRRNHTFLLMALMIFELGQREFVDADGGTYERRHGSLESVARQ